MAEMEIWWKYQHLFTLKSINANYWSVHDEQFRFVKFYSWNFFFKKKKLLLDTTKIVVQCVILRVWDIQIRCQPVGQKL